MAWGQRLAVVKEEVAMGPKLDGTGDELGFEPCTTAKIN